jgi:hypothetical protein
MEHTRAVFNMNAMKGVREAISNARIQATNEYLKKFTGQDLGSFRDSSPSRCKQTYLHQKFSYS